RHQVRGAARIRHRDVGRTGIRVRHRRDDMDARSRAALRRSSEPDHDRADQERGEAIPVAHRLRAARVRAEEGAMSRATAVGRIGAGLAALALGLAAVIVPMAEAAESTAGAVTRTRLANGFTVLVRENPVAPVLAVSLQVKMGNRWETRANAGISNLLQLMLVRGTTRLDGTQVVEAADRMGGSIDATSDMDASEISATALARYRTNILDLVADVALH